MRIPTSAIVMSLIAAVPFGLAIRDTVEGDAGFERNVDRTDAQASRRAADEAAQKLRDEEQRRLADAEAARAKARTAAAGELVGALFVTPGPAFALDTPSVGMHGAPFEITRTFEDDDVGCSTLAAVAARTWGEPAHDHVWLNLKTHQRASIKQPCALSFAAFQDAAEWVDALPLWAIDGPKWQLDHAYAATPAGVYVAPGLDGDDLTTIERVFDVGHRATTIGLQIYTSATPATQHRVAELLATRLGVKPTHDAATDLYTWKQPIPLRLELGDHSLVLDVGSEVR